MPRKTITHSQVHATYEIGKRIYSGEIDRTAALSDLESKHSMNSASAQFYISAFDYMLKGKATQKTINAYANNYYLENILIDYGPKQLASAIESLRGHVEYYEEKSNSNSKSIRSIIEKYEAILNNSRTLEAFNSKLSHDVAQALKKSQSEILKELEISNKKPEKITVTTEIFKRNQYVIAAALIRANGTCERCLKPAPFSRAKDGTPYLEVHHTIQLAHGGLDTLENVASLCPNCHRDLHFG